jgi:hypothetical protein
MCVQHVFNRTVNEEKENESSAVWTIGGGLLIGAAGLAFVAAPMACCRDEEEEFP